MTDVHYFSEAFAKYYIIFVTQNDGNQSYFFF